MMQIHVTEADISRGIEADCLYCPVALALQRTTGRLWYVLGFEAQAFHPAARLVLPREVAARIMVFDDGAGMRPFTFEAAL